MLRRVMSRRTGLLALWALVSALGCGGASTAPACNYNGKRYAANTTISEDVCGLCVCTASGQARCTDHICPPLDAAVGDGADASIDAGDGGDSDGGTVDTATTNDATADAGMDATPDATGDGSADGRHDGSLSGGVGAACWSDSDCPGGQFQTFPPLYCLAPDRSSTTNYGCPVCFTPPTTCASDDECAGQGPTSICALPGCSCSNVKTCLSGCATDTDCATGQSCAATHRCVPSSCGVGAPACPTDFSCGPAETCQRQACTQDSECSAACVIGRCYAEPGACTLPAA